MTAELHEDLPVNGWGVEPWTQEEFDSCRQWVRKEYHPCIHYTDPQDKYSNEAFYLVSDEYQVMCSLQHTCINENGEPLDGDEEVGYYEYVEIPDIGWRYRKYEGPVRNAYYVQSDVLQHTELTFTKLSEAVRACVLAFEIAIWTSKKEYGED